MGLIRVSEKGKAPPTSEKKGEGKITLSFSIRKKRSPFGLSYSASGKKRGKRTSFSQKELREGVSRI